MAVLSTVGKEAKSEGELPPLKGVFEEYFLAGVALDARELADPYAPVVLRHFGSLTLENQMKPKAIQPMKGRFTFEAADEIVAFARDNDLKIYGHVMVWHQATPDWFFQRADGTPLSDSPEDQAIALGHMKKHIEALARRYGDDVWAWDVVNEAIDERTDDGLRHSRWYEILGRDYIEHAFRFARAALPDDVKLFINEYGTENPRKLKLLRKLIEYLQDRDVPIDGVGHQFHVRLSTPIHQMENAIEAFSALGLIQSVTEFDVAISDTFEQVLTELPPGSLKRQGYFARDVFAMLKRQSDQIVSVTFWGLHDGRSWLKYLPMSRPIEAPLPFDENMEPKPFFWGLVDPERISSDSGNMINPFPLPMRDVMDETTEPRGDLVAADLWEQASIEALVPSSNAWFGGYVAADAQVHLNVIALMAFKTGPNSQMTSCKTVSARTDDEG